MQQCPVILRVNVLDRNTAQQPIELETMVLCALMQKHLQLPGILKTRLKVREDAPSNSLYPMHKMNFGP